MAKIDVSQVQFTVAPPKDQETGLLGYVSFTVAQAFRFDGVTLRQTGEGNLTLSYPARRDRHGHDHPHIRPADTPTRIDVEQQVFAALQGIRGRRDEP